MAESAKLVVTIKGLVQEFVCQHLVTIGRSKLNDISLPDPKVSRNHALVRCLGDGEYYLIDLGSSNGTIINGQRVLMPHALHHGDAIKMGKHEITFDSPLAETPDVTEDEDIEDTNPTMLTAASSLNDITLLVADVRNYTSLSEQIKVEDLSRLMARWCEVSARIATDKGGVVDKYIGDAVMVRWLSEAERNRSHCTRMALEAALAMQAEMGLLNDQFPGLPFPLRIGIGVNSGQAILGNVGGSSYRDYTVLGDCVNLAFRFETATKALGKDIVIGSESAQALPDVPWAKFETTVDVKGKQDALTVFALSFSELARLTAETSDTTQEIRD